MNLQEALINANIATENQVNNSVENTKVKYIAICKVGEDTHIEKFTSEKDALQYYEVNKPWMEIEMLKISDSENENYLVVEYDGFYHYIDEYNNKEKALDDARRRFVGSKGSWVKVYQVNEIYSK